MSDKEKKEREEEDVEEEEERILDHWSHEHLLSLVETRRDNGCYVCGGLFSFGEQAYGCRKRKCGYTKLLHEECARMPRKIRHSMHQHMLILHHGGSLIRWCAICEEFTGMSIVFKCSSSGCGFTVHMRCAQGDGTMKAVLDGDDDDDNDDEDQGRTIDHPSHPPNHQLRLLRRGSSFNCDACGTLRRGKSYVCTSCEYWIHERCALLPPTIEREDHHHSLSLSFHVPPQYLKYGYECEVCNRSLVFKYWIYHCELCRYAVHIKCAFKAKTTINDAIIEKGDIIQLPTDDVAEELIRPFVMRRGGGIVPTTIPPPPDHDGDGDDDETVNVKKYKFSLHKHQLSLISSSSSSHHDQNKDGESDDEDEYDWGKGSELICDACITPLFSDKSSSCFYYMSCSECRYYLHLACFDLPPRLPSLPVHNKPGHELVLVKSGDRLTKPLLSLILGALHCKVCGFDTNGLMYACQKCEFVADIKCASLPHTIHHAAHPQRLLNLVTPDVIYRNNLSWRKCSADCTSRPGLIHCFCYADTTNYEFIVHVGCTLLPASTVSRRWDKRHRLLLTYDANLNHPGEFYCDDCEMEMNPKRWMYHCRSCDLSFHPHCFPLASGRYRNVVFGQLYSAPEAHPHSLSYQLLTTKRRCDICGGYCYEWSGFHCASCNFSVCFTYNCGEKMEREGRIQPID